MEMERRGFNREERAGRRLLVIGSLGTTEGGVIGYWRQGGRGLLVNSYWFP